MAYTGRSHENGNDHITPLPDQLAPMLKELQGLSGNSPFIFLGQRDPLHKHISRDSL